MKLLSVNVSPPKTVEYRGRRVTTGIYKTPVGGRVALGETNLDGDAQADLEAHGGIHKAVYAYPVEHYAYWCGELNRGELRHGQFGENFTLEGLTEEDAHIGDRFQIGSAVVEVSQPRVPCYKLGMTMRVEGFEKRFLQSLRVGFYFRTVVPGEVGAGDAVELIATDPEGFSVRDITHLLYFDRDNMADAERALRLAALSPGWRASFEERLARR